MAPMRPVSHKEKYVVEPTFKSLDWLRNAIRYLLEVIAALSVLLLTLGLVSASWNFLDKDHIFGNAPVLQSLWGLDQALAIDANLPLVFVFLFAAVKHRDWIKVGIYAVIGGMLLFVAAIILDMESLRQALNIGFDAAALQVHVSIGVLTQVRSIATIGLVAMSGLTWTMLLVKKDDPNTPTAVVIAESKDLKGIKSPTPTPILPLSTESGVTDGRGTIKANGHTQNPYKRYIEHVAINPKATIPEIAKQLGVSPSTVSNYRRKSKKQHDELTEIHIPRDPAEANA